MANQRKKAYLALLTTALLWGVASPLIKYTLQFTSPFTFLFYRFLTVSLILFVPLIIRIIRIKPKSKDLFWYIILGFIGTPLTLGLLFLGIERATAVDTSIISLFNPILILLGGIIFLEEKISRRELWGISLIIAGSFLSVVDPLFKTGLAFSSNLKGNFLVFLSTLAWTTFSLLRRKFGEKLDSFILTASSFIVGFLLLLSISSFCDLRFTIHDSRILPGILYMSLFGSVIAYFTYIYGFSKIEASEATVFSYLEPVFAIPASLIFLGEKTSFLFWIGAVFIITGVFISEFNRRFRKAPSKPPSLDLKELNKV